MRKNDLPSTVSPRALNQWWNPSALSVNIYAVPWVTEEIILELSLPYGDIVTQISETHIKYGSCHDWKIN
jgi:hypothetical protein